MAKDITADKNQRREEARQKAMQIQKEQERRERRSRIIILTSVIAGLALVIGLAFVILSKAPQDLDPTMTAIPADVSAPAAASAEGAFALYKNEAVQELPADVPVLDLYMDFMCSHCANFETLHNDYLMEKQASGEMVFRIHPISILGQSAAGVRGATYSAVMDIDPLKAQEYAQWAFANQQSTSLDATAQAQFLENIGVAAADATKATDGSYERFIEAASMISRNNDVTGTPAIFLNGEAVTASYQDVEAFQGEVQARTTGE